MDILENGLNALITGLTPLPREVFQEEEHDLEDK